MNRPPVSVILLNYNHGKFLGEALSALKAALAPEDELLAFDDASTDDSVSIYRSRVVELPQMKLMLKSTNQGVIACENEGLAVARHPYVYFAASDDLVDPPFFDSMLTLFAAHPSAGLVACRARLIDRNGRNLGMLKTPKVLTEPGFLPPNIVSKVFLRKENWVVGSGTIYRRDALLAAGGFLSELGSFADGFACRVVAFRDGACFTPKVLSNWRQMTEGFATLETANLDKVRAIGERAFALMRGPYADTFPSGYPMRWYRRWMFGAIYYGWSRRITNWTKRGVATRGAGVRRLVAAISNSIVGAALFIYWRPRDIGEVLLRRIAYLRDGET